MKLLEPITIGGVTFKNRIMFRRSPQATREKTAASVRKAVRFTRALPRVA